MALRIYADLHAGGKSLQKQTQFEVEDYHIPIREDCLVSDWSEFQLPSLIRVQVDSYTELVFRKDEDYQLDKEHLAKYLESNPRWRRESDWRDKQPFEKRHYSFYEDIETVYVPYYLKENIMIVDQNYEKTYRQRIFKRVKQMLDLSRSDIEIAEVSPDSVISPYDITL